MSATNCTETRNSIDRYRVEKDGWSWVVRCGDGTQILHSFFFRNSALACAQRLTTAFRDGVFVGHRSDASPTFDPEHDIYVANLQRIAEMLGFYFAQNSFVPSTTNEEELVALLQATGNYWETIEDYEASYQEKIAGT
jgi:hypothetical protein